MLGECKIFTRRLLGWYARNRRDLPWRTGIERPGPLDPYHVLVSETMLQQTQVATVVPYFSRFLQRFPTLEALAGADEQQVLRLWQGLGYYSRARNLQAAAQKVLSGHGGALPASVERLLELPGIGRYTAGAIASIAFGIRAPVLDGNVTRVLCRLDCIRTDPRQRAIRQQLWSRAAEIVPQRRPGDFNSALMELGATVCIPKTPQCDRCPVRRHCEGLANRMQREIPPPKKATPTPLIRRQTYCIHHDGKWLIEQRPARGRWAGMWQFITREPVSSASPGPIPRLPVRTGKPRRLGLVRHALTHRRYEFEVFVARSKTAAIGPGSSACKWAGLDDLDRHPFPRPHLEMMGMIAGPRR